MRDKALSKRAAEQLPLPFGSREEWQQAVELAERNPDNYIFQGYHRNPNFDAITEKLLANTANNPNQYRKWIYGGDYLKDPKFHNFNLQYMAAELQQDPVEFLRDDWYRIKQFTPDNEQRKQIINQALENLLENDLVSFWQVAGTWDMPVDEDLRDRGRDEAFQIANDNPEAYFEEYHLHYAEGLEDIADDAAINLARDYPKRYLEMLNGNFWDDFEYRAHAFEIMSKRLADEDPEEFFEELYENLDEYKGAGLTIPADAIINAGEWMAENNPDDYIELGLNNIPELNEVTRKLGLAGATLPKDLSAKGYQYSVDNSENNYMSIYSSSYPNMQRHPEAAHLERYDVALNWPANSPMRKIQKVIADDYQSYVHDIGNSSSTKSFGLIALDPEQQSVLIEEIQSDFPTVLHNMKRDNYFQRAQREGVNEQQYNEFSKQMSEHMAAYPYLVIKRVAELADQNKNINSIKLSSARAVMSFAGITNKKKAERVYKNVPEELGFDMNQGLYTRSLSDFIKHDGEPGPGFDAEYSEILFEGASAHTLLSIFRGPKLAPGSEPLLYAAAKELAENHAPDYIESDMYTIKEFEPLNKMLEEKHNYRITPPWSTYSGDMKELAQRAAAGAERAIEKLYEKSQKKKPVSRREKKPRKLDIEGLRPEVEKIIGERADQIEFSNDVGSFMRSVGRLRNEGVINRKEQNQITGLINKYVRAFLDALIVKVANMYGIESPLSKRAKVMSESPAYKKKEKSESGNDIYRYDEKHIEKRWKEKKEKLKKLEKDIEKVRKQYKEDLKSDDDRTRAIAAIVGIMDETAMRIGNEDSAKEGTYGASTLKVKHVKGGKGKMTFDFPGKGAIEQNISLDNNEIIKVIRDLMKGKKGDDFIFEIDGKKIWDRAVNRYLKPMGISAKDLRGFQANYLMKEMLKKKDFKEALDEVAEIVGHKASTLKSQYLDPELVEKHEKKKEAAISYRVAAEPFEPQYTPTLEKQIGDLFNKSKYGPDAMSRPGPSPKPKSPEQTKPQTPPEPDPTTLVDLNRNVGNVEGDIANYPALKNAWKTLAPFLPEGAKLTSGWRSDNDQARIIIDYWLSGWWPNHSTSEVWRRNKGFFYTNFEGPEVGALRWWRGKVVSGTPVGGRLYRAMNRHLEPLRKIMTTYKPTGKPGEPPSPLKIAPLGTSMHLKGLAFDVSGVPLKTIQRAVNYINRNVAPLFARALPEKGQDAVHLVINPETPAVNDRVLAGALLDYQSSRHTASISKRALDPGTESYVDKLENKYFGTPLAAPDKPKSIKRPIGKRKMDDDTRAAKKKLRIAPGARINETIVSAWATLRPFLPPNARMTSGARTPEDQIRIINNYWRKSGLNQKYPDVTEPVQRSKLLRKHKWIVGPPIWNARGNVHQSGRAFDISGADLQEIAAAAHRVSKDPNIPVTFSQVLVEPKNNAVHIGVKEARWDMDAVRNALSGKSVASIEGFLSKTAESEWKQRADEELASIYEDLLASDPPEDILEEYQEAFSISRNARLITENELRWYGSDYADDEPNKYEHEKDDPKWDKALLSDGKDWTRREIRNHYQNNADKILKEIKGEPVMIYIGTGKNQNILKRKHNDKPIVLNSKDDLMYWADRRLLSVHRVFGGKTDLGFVDLDVHGDFPQSEVKNYARNIASNIKSKYKVSPTIYDSGGSGYHIEFRLGSEEDTDTLRNELREMCEDLNEEYEGFTTGIVKGSGVRTDVTTLKDNGNIRVPYALHESKGGVKKPMTKKSGLSIRDVSLSKRAFDDYEEFKREMGMGFDDELGDWFEKSPIFRYREEEDIPEYDEISADESEAKQLAENDPDKFFYRGLHKEHPDLELTALKNILDDNAKFYFVFKYHEHEEPEFQDLAEEAAEALSQQDVRAFFYYHLHHKFPELGRGAIIQLIDTNPDTFFDLGLQKDYPDYEEAAGHARNIKDPHKVELEMPEWMNDEPDKPMSVRDRNASRILSVRQANGIVPVAPMKLRKMEDPDKMLDDYDDSDIWVQQKIDGFKTQAIKDSQGAVKLYTRRGEDFTSNVDSLVKELEDKMDKGDFWLGEMAYIKNGKQSISDIQTVVGSNPEKAKEKLKEKGQIVFYVYDMLWNDGSNITKTPYEERYNKLKKQVGNGKAVQIVKNYTWAEMDKAIKDALDAGGEGVVLKPKDSEYKFASKGSNEPVGEWVKHKPAGKKANKDEVILKEYTMGKDKLIFPMYQHKGGELFEVGKISGMSKEDEAKIKKDIDAGKKVVIEITFQERMESGKFRHPGWSRFRPDKSAKEVKASRNPLSKRDAAAGDTRPLTIFPGKGPKPDDPDATKPEGLNPRAPISSEELKKRREEQRIKQINEALQGEEPDYTMNPMDTTFDQEVDIRDMKPFDVVRYFLFKHYKRDKYSPYNKEILPKLLVVQPSKFFDLELFNDPQFADETRRAVFHVAVLEPQYFKRFIESSFPEMSEGYRDLADKALAEGKSDAERRQELMQQKLSFRNADISKRAGKLDYPKQMLEDIREWVLEVAPKFKRGIFRKPVEKLSKVFPININDTEQYQKHSWVPETFNTIQNAGWDTKLEVTLYRTSPYEDQRTGGAYDVEEGDHEIWVFNVLNEIKSGELGDTLKHELTHMMQSIMTTLVQTAEQGKFEGEAGMPTHYEPEQRPGYGTTGLSDWGKVLRQYRRQDIEFAPFLQESISRMKSYVGQGSPEERQRRFMQFISDDEFLADLRGYDSTRYNKALRELYRAFDEEPAISQRAKDKWEDKLPGGLADEKQPEDFDSEQLEKGVKVELEHVDDKQLAKEIAMDHLMEDPKYYDKLEKVEKHSSLALSKRAADVRYAKDPLSTYKKKRDFDDTKEPEGKAEKGKNQYRFVIQRHKAKQAGEHFDLRLENDDGAMSSWAIPKHKLPSGKENLLAAKTEDHPISYNKFEGEIPEGEYGAGNVSIHDSGKYEEIERSTNKIVFKLKGSKEKGTYTLAKTDGKKWLIMVHKDDEKKEAALSIRHATEKPRYIIEMDKSEWLGITTIDVEVSDTETDKILEDKEFKGSIDEIWLKATDYVKKLQRKYSPSRVVM